MEHDHLHPAPGSLRTEEALALLRYMAQHNAHHAEELLETKSALPASAAAHIQDAVALLQQSTQIILQAIKETEGS